MFVSKRNPFNSQNMGSGKPPYNKTITCFAPVPPKPPKKLIILAFIMIKLLSDNNLSDLSDNGPTPPNFQDNPFVHKIEFLKTKD
jgi:hypothetical protein